MQNNKTISRIKIVWVFSFVICFVYCKNNESNYLDSDEVISQVFENYHHDYLKLFPRRATEFGNHDYDTIFENDISNTHRKSAQEFYIKYQQKLATIDTSNLNEENKFSFDILEYMIESGLEELNFPNHLLPVQHTVNCVPADFAEWGSGEAEHPFNTVEDYDNFLKRMDGFVTWVDTAIANMRSGIEQKIVLPKLVTRKTIDRINPYLSNNIDSSIFYKPIKTLPNRCSKKDFIRLDKAYRKAILEKINPCYKKFLTFLEKEYLPNCRETIAWMDLPDGENWYNQKVKSSITTQLTPEEIHKIGLAEVERVSRLYQERIDDKTKEWPLKLYSNSDSLVEAYQSILDKCKPLLDTLFGFSPKTKLIIKPSILGSYYEPGSEDATRPGVFNFYVSDLKNNPDVVSIRLFLHEAIPGHHYQISIQRESSIPNFRKHAFYLAYMEGWGLYSENLGYELNLYEDPRQIRWKLEGELWRAIRLVVDTGIHSKNWSIEDCITYVEQYHFGSEMRSEFERYIAEPGQALSYKIGEQSIKKMRKKAEEEIKEKFNLKSFHYEVLKMGAVPLDLFEKRMNSWIKTQKYK